MKKLAIAIMGMLFLLAPLAAGTLTVTSPNGGETLTLGSAGRIAWTAAGVSDNVKLILLNENNTIYGVIVRDLAPGGSPYPWTVGDTEIGRAPAGRYKVRISTMDGGTKDVSDAAFTLAPEGEPARSGTLVITSPRAGDSWREGTLHNITWDATGLSGLVNLRLVDGGNFHWLGSADATAESFPWIVDNFHADAGNENDAHDYHFVILHNGTSGASASGDFHIVHAAASGHDFVISDPYLEQRSSGKGFRVKVTDRSSDFSGWVVISHYCLGMGLGHAVQERRRLELRQGVPATVNLANVRGSLFDGQCDVTFRFDVNPDHAVAESNYDNNRVSKKFCWLSGHDGRFFSLRLGRNYTNACKGCSVAIRPGDVESIDGGSVSIRLEITLQNCGMTAIRGGGLMISESWNGGLSVRSVRMVRDIDIEPGHYKLINETVTLERHADSGLHIHFNCGETGSLDANNNFACYPNFVGF